jgi:hypothetical protein
VGAVKFGMTDLVWYRAEFEADGELDDDLVRLQGSRLTMPQIERACREHAVRARVTSDDGTVRWMEADGVWEPEEPTEPARPAPTRL